MDLGIILQYLLIILCLFSVVFLIFIFINADFNTDVDEVLNMYRSELKRTERELNEGNKKIDKIEKEIFICKKKLNKL